MPVRHVVPELACVLAHDAAARCRARRSPVRGAPIGVADPHQLIARRCLRYLMKLFILDFSFGLWKLLG